MISRECSSDTDESTLVSSELIDTSSPLSTPQTSSSLESLCAIARSVEHVVLMLKRRLVRICRKAQRLQQVKKQKRKAKARKTNQTGPRDTPTVVDDNHDTVPAVPEETIPISTSGAQGIPEAENVAPSVDWIAPDVPVIEVNESGVSMVFPVEVYLHAVQEEAGNILKVNNYATTVETLHQERVEEQEATIDGEVVFEQKILAQTVAQAYVFRVRETSIQLIDPNIAYVQSCVRTKKLLQEATFVDYALAGIEFPSGPVVDRFPVVHAIPSDEVIHGKVQCMCRADDPLISYLLSKETAADEPLEFGRFSANDFLSLAIVDSNDYR